MNNGGPAFPTSAFPIYVVSEEVDNLNIKKVDFPGMNLRDYFAAKAMHLISLNNVPFGPEMVAKEAYEIADAMIAQREHFEGKGQ